MKIIVVAMARNEDDVIESFVRWHVRHADHLIVMDHASRDRTREILEALRDEGLPLEVHTDERAELDQSRATLALAKRAACDLGADWVLPFDVDEFLVAEPPDPVRLRLEKLEPDSLHRVDWQSYVPTPEEAVASGPPLARIRHRRAAESVQHHKLLVPGALLRRRGVSLTMGNHRLRQRTALATRTVPAQPAPGLRLAHFPVRSVEQARTKALVGWLARLASSEQRDEPRKNLHLRRLFERLRDGTAPDAEDVTRFAYHHAGTDASGGARWELVEDPLLGPGEALGLRYTRDERIPALAALADLAERFAVDLSRLRDR